MNWSLAEVDPIAEWDRYGTGDRLLHGELKPPDSTDLQ